jgi:DNA-binding NtrC family response regulator
MAERILFVDDEPAVLEGYQRLLSREFDVETAVGGEQGLEKLAKDESFAVVVSDMRMPQMDGAQFLAKVMLKFPSVVRVMLTGNSDLQAAMRAVNEGNIYRFLTKPCEKDELVRTINAALVQHRVAHFKNNFYKAAVASGPPPLAKPARDMALEDAAEHVKELLAKGAKTRLPSTSGGIYVGKTIWIGPEHVVQRISSTIAVAHPKKLLDATPDLGDVVRIEYVNGYATVESNER